LTDKFPIDAPKVRVIKALEILGFKLLRDKEHVSMVRANPDGSNTPLTIPGYRRLKSSTLRTTCAKAGISREDFLRAYDQT
jgi:hypothetical protein